VVRGISDLIDDKTADNDARWQPVAAANAAAFGMQLLEGLQQVRSPLEEGSNEVLRGVADWLRQSYYVNLLALLRDPTARPFLTDEVMGWLENARSWNDFNLANGIRMLDVAARVCKGWEAPAVAIDNAIDRDLLGARVVFDGRFRTRNLRHFDAERGLSGDLERDPVLYTDIAGTRVFLPIDPKWITTTTGSHVFGGGQLRASGVGTLRTLEDGHALVSPMVIGPWAEAERMTAMVFGGSGSR
jgi:hypothetical protein